ncbi:MAG: DUF3859 domain-containing protein [Pseudomonadota bacterium]
MAKGAFIALLFCPLPALAAGISFDKSRVGELRYGLVCGSDTAETIPAPQTAQGTIQKREDWQNIILETQIIPLVKGMALGVDVAPAGPREIGDVTITVTHPPFNESGLTIDKWSAKFTSNGSNLNFFEFEVPDEMVEGIWTMTARKGIRTLYTVSFKVVDPATVPEMANLCDGISLTS